MHKPAFVIALSWFAVIACRNGAPESAQNTQESSKPESAMTESSLPTCATVAECDQHDHERVQVIGVYRRENPNAGRKGDDGSSTVSFIDLGDGEGPYLEPFWHEDAHRPQQEIDRFDGKRVRVTGTYHSEQPRAPGDPEHAAALGGGCIHPVETIEAVP